MWKRARQKQAWALGENLKKCVGATIAISLLAAKKITVIATCVPWSVA